MTVPIYDRIRRFTFLAIFTLVMSFGVAALAVVWKEERIATAQQKILTFHDPTLQFAGQAVEGLRGIETDMLMLMLGSRRDSEISSLGHEPELHSPMQVHLQGHLHSTDKSFESIMDLQSNFPDTHFAATLKKISHELRELRDHSHRIPSDHETSAIAELIQRSRATALSFNQLERIHLIMRTDKNRQIERDIDLRNFVVIPSAIIVIICGFVVFRYLTRQTRQALIQLEQSEHALQDLNQTLEARVEQRTNELHEAQDAQMRNERLAAIGQLTATVSHEIRNPLGALQSAVGSLKHLAGSDNKLVCRSVALAERSIDRLNNIVRDLLDFSRRPELNPVPTRIDGWLSSQLDEYHLPTGIKLKTRLDCSSIVELDPERFRRVLVNLLDNACQAMLSKEVEQSDHQLTVSCSRSSENVEIAITDNGPGIAAEHLRKIFDPLYSTKSIGAGLGLTIVKQIVEQHQGSIELSCREGQGTTATIRLPLKLQPEQSAAA